MTSCYVTTPIYYVNDHPHIGTAYSTIAADVIARYNRLRGRPTRFVTGLDEHGLKLERRAQQEGLEPKEFVDRMAPPFREAWTLLDCEYDDFIRTTEARHEQKAQALWERVKAAGDIYLADYEDWYCVGCETFYTEKELLPGNVCPQHQQPVERIKEASYFFRLGDYTDKLLAFYEAHPQFVRPESRYNEVKSFVREGLRDLSISRTSFRWGVPVPDDPEHVMYVWFDALTNYISALGGPAASGEAPLFDRFWGDDARIVHIVGKDILRFHAVYWPAFLLSAGIRPPDQIWAHGWLTVNGQKMSKTLGNFLHPEPLVEAFGSDVLRYYLMRDVAFGQDGDFSHPNLIARYHGDLGNGLGNLLNRMVGSIVKKHLGGAIPPRVGAREPIDEQLIDDARRAADKAAQHMEAIAPYRALESIWELISAANKYVDQTAPWSLAKKGETERLQQVVYTVLEALRWIANMVWPFMPNKADQLRQQLGLPALLPNEGHDSWPSAWGGLTAGTATRPGEPLFPRIDAQQERALLERFGVAPEAPEARQPVGAKAPTQGGKTAGVEGVIEFADFARVQLRVGRVVSATRVDKSERLLRLAVDVGEEKPRQILAGIAQHYDPAALDGARVVVVANLKPRKLMGHRSEGMLLAASDEQHLELVTVAGDMAPGSRVS